MKMKNVINVKKMKDELYTHKTIKTFTGHYIDVFNPKPETITIEDIAHALSNTARWGGHTEYFYSVASHSLWVADNVPLEFQLEALLHDGTEAYIGDMPKPIKMYLPDFNKLEKNLDIAIRNKFGLPLIISSIVKQADIKSLEFEWENVKLSNYTNNKTNHQIRDEFIKKFYSLWKNN